MSANDCGLTDKELDAALTQIDRGLRQESDILEAENCVAGLSFASKSG
jgi:hypothetical protein